MKRENVDTGRIDDAVLALMYLTLHDADQVTGTQRAWKSFDWDALGRLHQCGLILDPVNMAKSVVLTSEGRRRCEDLFYKLFAKQA